jgi:hypothetical protein
MSHIAHTLPSLLRIYLPYRDAYHEAVQLGNELTKKASSTERDRSSDDDEDDIGGNSNADLADRVSERLGALLEGDGLSGADEIEGKYKGLFDMAFMRKAKEAKKERAREEAKDILREIQTLEQEDEDSDDEGNNALAAAAVVRGKEEEEKLAEARNQIKKMMAGGGSLALSGGGKTIVSEVVSSNPWLQAPQTTAPLRSEEVGNKGSNKNSKSKKASGVLKESAGKDVDAVGALRAVGGAVEGIHTHLPPQSNKPSQQLRGSQNNNSNAVKSKPESSHGSEKKQGEKRKADSAQVNQPQRKPLLMQKSQV